MITVFLALWLAYTGHALYRNVTARGTGSAVGHILQLGLVILAIWWTFQAGLFTRALWSPLDITLGLVLGHLLFGVSLFITHRHVGDVARHFVDARGMVAFVKATPELMVRFAGVCVIEELVYRAGAQDMLMHRTGSPFVAIVVTALCFCVLHQHFFQNGWACALEFLLFSLIIGMVYYHTYSLTIVTLAHLIRNVESAYLEYCVLREENNDHEEALRILSARNASPALESP